MTAVEQGTQELLRVEMLRKVFEVEGMSVGRRGARRVHAIDGVDFTITRGETFGLVGESGCGKSTIARCILRLTEPTSGRIAFDGIELGRLAPNELRSLRRRMQILFQDPHSSLDPRMTIGALLEEPLQIHGVEDRHERRARVGEMLRLVGLDETHGERKPHAFSGGQRQRISLARALILNPEFLVLDEPVSALDVSIQAQILNLLTSLQERLRLTYLFIGHDLSVAEYFCDRVAVLYLGTVMELASARELFRSPLNPYTVSLMSAVPVPDPTQRRRGGRIVLTGEVHQAGDRPPGCPFQPRCPVGRDRQVCVETRPSLALAAPGHAIACHFPGELTLDRPGDGGAASPEISP